jgi:hypothetical protein
MPGIPVLITRLPSAAEPLVKGEMGMVESARTQGDGTDA